MRDRKESQILVQNQILVQFPKQTAAWSSNSWKNCFQNCRPPPSGPTSTHEHHLYTTPVSSLTEELQTDKRRSRGPGPRMDFTLFLFMFVRQSSMIGCFTFILLFVYFIIKTLHWTFACSSFPLPRAFNLVKIKFMLYPIQKHITIIYC